ncbi:hypothetical protein IGI46_002234 [Enterococcus sp. AZ163]
MELEAFLTTTSTIMLNDCTLVYDEVYDRSAILFDGVYFHNSF